MNAFALRIAPLAILLCGCTTTPEGERVVDVARVSRIAGRAAYFGTVAFLNKEPDKRALFEVAAQALASLEDTKNYDYAAFAKAMQGLPIREFKGSEGSLYVEAALVIWDEVLQFASPVMKKELVAATVHEVRVGLERALAVELTKPLPKL